MMNADNVVATTNDTATSTVTLTTEPKQPQHIQQPQPQHQPHQQQISSIANPSQLQNGNLKPPSQPSAQLKKPPPSNQQHESEPMQPKGPIHVLMKLPSTRFSSSPVVKLNGRVDNGKPRSKPTKRERMQRLLLDPVLQGDYVSKRLKAYQRCMPNPGEAVKDQKTKPTQQQQQSKAKSKQGKLALNQPKWKAPTSVWDGVSRVEQDLVNCCESISESSSSSSYLESYSASSDAQDDGDDDEETQPTQGALQIQKEVQFVGILARDCHTLSAKSLALSILERTLQLHLAEDVDEEEEDEEEMEEEEATTPLSEAAKGDTADAKNHQSPGTKRSSTESDDSTSEQPQKKQKLEDIKSEPASEKVESGQPQDDQEEEEEEDEEEEEEEDEEDSKPERLEGFLAAGGLKILNRWLIEACTEEMEPPPKLNVDGKGQLPTPKPKPPATRPLILPMLRFLEQIPFDKKVVLDAKINKQIRKLGKHVTAIRKATEQNTHEPVDLQNWSLDPTVNAKDALDDVHQAIKDLKSSWEQMAKHDPRQFDDPFESLKSKMKERLDELVQYEIGEAPKPAWFDDVEAGKSNSKKPPKSKTSSTKELAAKERLAERENLKRQLHAAQTEHRERLAKLRETFLKRSNDTDVASLPNTIGKKKNGKSVAWKDGLRSQSSRNREELEQVFVFEKESPPAQDLIEMTDDDIDEDGPIADILMDDDDGPLL